MNEHSLSGAFPSHTHAHCMIAWSYTVSICAAACARASFLCLAVSVTHVCLFIAAPPLSQPCCGPWLEQTSPTDDTPQVLQLSHNALEVLPISLLALTALTFLDVSYNRLTALPFWVGSSKLQQLRRLNLVGAHT